MTLPGQGQSLPRAQVGRKASLSAAQCSLAPTEPGLQRPVPGAECLEVPLDAFPHLCSQGYQATDLAVAWPVPDTLNSHVLPPAPPITIGAETSRRPPRAWIPCTRLCPLQLHPSGPGPALSCSPELSKLAHGCQIVSFSEHLGVMVTFKALHRPQARGPGSAVSGRRPSCGLPIRCHPAPEICRKGEVWGKGGVQESSGGLSRP